MENFMRMVLECSNTGVSRSLLKSSSNHNVVTHIIIGLKRKFGLNVHSVKSREQSAVYFIDPKEISITSLSTSLQPLPKNCKVLRTSLLYTGGKNYKQNLQQFIQPAQQSAPQLQFDLPLSPPPQQLQLQFDSPFSSPLQQFDSPFSSPLQQFDSPLSFESPLLVDLFPIVSPPPPFTPISPNLLMSNNFMDGLVPCIFNTLSNNFTDGQVPFIPNYFVDCNVPFVSNYFTVPFM